MRRILSLVLCACLMLTLTVCSYAASPLNPGTYEASAQGFGGTVTVTLTFDAEKVTEAVVVGSGETPSVGGAAIEQFNTSLVGITSADEVDAVSGATFTSTAVKAAVDSAFAQAQETAPVAEIDFDSDFDFPLIFSPLLKCSQSCLRDNAYKLIKTSCKYRKYVL